jgi:hypothetical protein
MKKIIILILVILPLILVAQAGADHIQGRLYIQDSQTGSWYAAGAGFKITVKLLDINFTPIEGCIADVYTISTGDYSYNFSTTTGAVYVSSTYQFLTLKEDFDGCVRIDIYYDAEQPEPNPEPNNE